MPFSKGSNIQAVKQINSYNLSLHETLVLILGKMMTKFSMIRKISSFYHIQTESQKRSSYYNLHFSMVSLQTEDTLAKYIGCN